MLSRCWLSQDVNRSAKKRFVVAMNLSDPRWAKLTPLFGAVICGLLLAFIVTQGQPYSLLSLLITVILVACVLWLVLRRRI